MQRFLLVLIAAAALLTACESGGAPVPPTSTPSADTAPTSSAIAGTALPATQPGSSTTAPTISVPAPVEPASLDWVAMDSAEVGWGRTTTGEVVRTEDGGANWRRAGLDRPISPDAAVYAAGDFGWIAEPSGGRITVWRTDTGGAQWVSVELMRDADAGVFLPHAIVFPDPSRGWLLVQLDGAAGTVFVDLYATVDGGASWTKATGPPPTAANAALESGHSLDIDFNSAGRGWVTKDIGALPGAHLAATSDNGITWRDVSIQGTGSRFCATRDPYTRDALGGSVLVECDDGSAWLAMTSDDGAAWELFALPEPATQAFRFEDGAFAWGDSLMEWLGPPEEFQRVHTFAVRPTSVSIPDAVHVFAVMEGRLWRSNDQGRTWMEIDAMLAA